VLVTPHDVDSEPTPGAICRSVAAGRCPDEATPTAAKHNVTSTATATTLRAALRAEPAGVRGFGTLLRGGVVMAIARSCLDFLPGRLLA
jgi:hypothetical protein